MTLTGTTLFILLVTIAGVHSLSCLPCNVTECQTPTNCAGSFAKDACSCCQVCAKQEDERCGGIFNIGGTCEPGLKCMLPEPTVMFPGTRTMVLDIRNIEGECRKTYTSCTDFCQSLSSKGKRPVGTAVHGFSTVLKGKNEDYYAYCDCTDFLKDGSEAWTIIQRRIQDTVGFDKKWDEYKKSFGVSFDDYWIGLDNLHDITSAENHELMITIEYKNSNYDTTSTYSTFSVGNEKSGYQLFIGGNNGRDSSEFVINHNGMKFSTKDRDNDEWVHGSCAEWYKGGWWYNSCTQHNLNGVMYNMLPLPSNTRIVLKQASSGPDRISWKDCDPKKIKMVEMKIRRTPTSYYYR